MPLRIRGSLLFNNLDILWSITAGRTFPGNPDALFGTTLGLLLLLFKRMF